MKLFDKNALKILWPFYMEAFVGTLLVIYIPFMVVYMNSIGLNAYQIGLLLAAIPLATLLFEIPTGAIADLYGRKFSVVLGWLLGGISLIAVYFFTSFSALLLLFALFGAFMTLTSGSYDAWVVDLLRAKKMKEKVQSYFSNRLSLLNLAHVFSGVVGAFIVFKFGLNFIWLLTGASFILTAFFLCFGEEVYEPRKSKIKESAALLWKQTRDSIQYCYGHHVLFLLFLIMFILAASMTLESVISMTSFLKMFNLPDYAFGYVWSAMAVFGVFAPLISKKFAKEGKEKRILILKTIAMLLIGVFVLIASNVVMAVIVIVTSTFLIDFENPVLSTYFHRFVPSKIRATSGSLMGIIYAVAGIIFLPITGYLVEAIGGRYTIFIAMLLAVPMLLLYLMINESKTA